MQMGELIITAIMVAFAIGSAISYYRDIIRDKEDHHK